MIDIGEVPGFVIPAGLFVIMYLGRVVSDIDWNKKPRTYGGRALFALAEKIDDLYDAWLRFTWKHRL